MNWQEYIHADPQILNGKPVIKGTRLSIEFILERLSDGWSEQMLLENYPRLSHESLLAVYVFMLQMAKDGLLYLPTYPMKQAS
ncbi:DUF433 domain-containing protein [Runella aurantiaca]|uniref:DUF433 domain-containing protein n=1 Tax=Runella aurantiaca TaxID=2282308 RepID=A0A369IL35_9BACT|nr:DUF433 domain-containing protein [Runella aurantiaca]RDB08083.1 DUF433 domain-containing protein [Runella aurantiaca]